MEVDILYKVNRGNATEAAGFLIKGAAVSIQVLGSQSVPEALTDLVDLTDGAAIDAEGAYPFTMLPEYIYFTGSADSIEIVNWSVEKELGPLA